MRSSEQRARVVARDLLTFRNWDLRPIWSGGQLLEEAEYRSYRDFLKIFDGKSKSGPGFAKPDFLLVDSPASRKPLVVIETKPRAADLEDAVREAEHYGNALLESGRETLSVAVAGADKEICEVRVQRKVDGRWRNLTLHNRAIDWIPSPGQTALILSNVGRTEVAPERPTDAVLAEQAALLNEILRECKIKDEFRPIYAATFLLGTWKADVETNADVVLDQINANASRALKDAKKPELATSLRVDVENEDLANSAWRIIDILKKLNIRSFEHEHDYLGQLYETFFRYTGGNTIGQYFTPRHIIDMMCEMVNVGKDDRIFDPACGTGGFLIGALRRMVRSQHLSYEEAVERVKNNVFGIESEPSTAALCVTNMILRGDGKSGVLRANCFTRTDYPDKAVDAALLNPPFPHSKDDRPATDYINRAALSVRNHGLVASIVPYSLLVKTGDWHRDLLKSNRLLAVVTMPPDLFLPYAAMNTAVLVFEKGTPHGDQRVFFARLWNDGYKLKKNVRIPIAGSQIETILDEYQRRRSIHELTAVAPVNAKTVEWSPESVIESAPHTDADFISGFEQSLRNHAAFYIAEGHRLMAFGRAKPLEAAANVFDEISQVSLDGVRLGQFALADYFNVVLGGKDEIEDLDDDGDTPIVSTSSVNNGVSAWKQARISYKPPVITIATDGSTGSSFVQEVPFYAFYKVAMLRPRQTIPVDALYYIAYIVSRESWRYVYARKFGKGRLLATKLYGPVLADGTPDFETMAALTRRCGAHPIIASFRDVYTQDATRRFRELVGLWKAERAEHTTVARMTSAEPYQDIIRMGHVATPLILRELEERIDHWFVALNAITGVDPVRDEDRGRLDRMAAAWLDWGKSEGIIT